MSEPTSIKAYFNVRKRPGDHRQKQTKRRKTEDVEDKILPSSTTVKNAKAKAAQPLITAKQCASPVKRVVSASTTDPSPLKYETRGMTAVRKALLSSPGKRPPLFKADGEQNSSREMTPVPTESPKLEKSKSSEFISPQKKPIQSPASKHFGSPLKLLASPSSLLKSETKVGKTAPIQSPMAASRHFGSPTKLLSSPSSSLKPESRVRKTAVRRALLSSPKKRPTTRGAVASGEEERSSDSVLGESPKLERFKVFEFTSPRKKPSMSRRLNYSLLCEPTPAEVELRKDLSDEPSSSTKMPTKNLPAYQKFSYLTESPPVKQKDEDITTRRSATDSSVDLKLPYAYQLLEEKFKATDTVSSMLHKRNEICTFDKLKQSVQRMMKRNYEKKNLGQIKNVYPEAYLFRQEKNIPGNVDKYRKYQLTIEPTAHEGNDNENGGSTIEKLPAGAGLPPSVLVRRGRRFHTNLLNVVIDHHNRFLSSLDPPVKVDKFYRWHPLFELDSLPDVAEADLPKPPITESYTTAKDVLNATKTKFTDRLNQALEAVSSPSSDDKAEDGPSKNINTPVTPALKGVSSSLVERIRLKEAVKVRADMMRNPEEEKKLKMLSRLPEMCRILKSLYISEGKVALLLEYVVKKIQDSHSSGLTTDQIEEHLDFLITTISGQFIKKVVVRKLDYLKLMDKNISIKELCNMLKQ